MRPAGPDARLYTGRTGQETAHNRSLSGAEWPVVDAQRIVNSPNPIQVRRQLALPVADGDQADLVAKFAVVRVQIVVERTVHGDHRG